MIPLRLLAVPGTALVLLLAAIFSDRLWPLDFLHVTFGGLWTGVDLFMGFVVGPVLRRLDPPVRGAFMRRLMPMMMVVMPTLVLVTMTAGWQLGRKLGVLDTPYPRHWWLVVSFVIVAILIMLVEGIFIGHRVRALAQERLPGEDTRGVRVYAAMRALQDPQYYARRYAQTHLLRERLGVGLSALGWQIVPGAANFLPAHPPGGGPSGGQLVRACQRRGLFLRDASSRGARRGRRAVRVAVKDAATTERMLEMFKTSGDRKGGNS